MLTSGILKENFKNAQLTVNVTVLEWFNSNFLYLNSSKTTYIRFHTHQNKRDQDLNLSAGNQGIVRTTSTTFLGLTIDQHLN